MQTALQFKNFELSNYPEVIELHNRVYPSDPTGLEPLKTFDTQRSVSRVLVKKGNTLIAYFQFRPNDNSTETGLVINIVCDNTLSPDDLANIYSNLKNTIRTENPKHLITRILETETTLHRYFLSQAFIEEERMWPSTLNLNSFNRLSLEGALEKAQSQGIQFKTLADFEDNLNTQTMYYNCVRQCLKDVPTAEPIRVWSFERWKERFWDSKEFVISGSFMAFDKNSLVGLTQLFPSVKAGNIKTGLTGVLATHRNKGIAKALKLLATDYAINNAYQTITTNNHSINKPMLAINEAMGYTKSPALIFLKRELKDSFKNII